MQTFEYNNDYSIITYIDGKMQDIEDLYYKTGVKKGFITYVNE